MYRLSYFGKQHQNFLLNVKSGIRKIWHTLCIKMGMDTKIKKHKTAEEICQEILEYIQSEDRDYIPSCEEFYLKYDYGMYDIISEFLTPEVQNMLSKVKNQETAMTKRYAILADPEYTDSSGKVHKLNKRELSKRHTKVLKRK